MCVGIFKNFKCIHINIYMYVCTYIYLFIILAIKNNADVYLFFKPLYGELVWHTSSLFPSSPTPCLSCSVSVSLAPSLFLCVCLHLIKFCRFLSVIVIVAFFAHSLCSSSLSFSRFYPSRRCAITLITFIKPFFY